jgi:hypothetical protein
VIRGRTSTTLHPFLQPHLDQRLIRHIAWIGCRLDCVEQASWQPQRDCLGWTDARRASFPTRCEGIHGRPGRSLVSAGVAAHQTEHLELRTGAQARIPSAACRPTRLCGGSQRSTESRETRHWRQRSLLTLTAMNGQSPEVPDFPERRHSRRLQPTRTKASFATFSACSASPPPRSQTPASWLTSLKSRRFDSPANNCEACDTTAVAPRASLNLIA